MYFLVREICIISGRYVYDICFVLKKELVLLPNVLYQSPKLKYDRVCVITIDSEECMSCTHDYALVGNQG